MFGGAFPFSFVLIPFVVWSALQFGARDTATVVGIVAALQIGSTLRGFGPVDMTNARELEETLEHAARLDKGAIVISFASAWFFDSKAIHSLYRFGRRLATNRRELRLVIPSGRPARWVAEVAGLTDAFPVFDSAEDATTNLTAGS